jgi:hypothetical protein
MERQLLKEIVAVAKDVVEGRGVRDTFDDVEIVRVYYWSVLCDRPQGWACERRNWPIWDRRGELPSESTLSRRLRSTRMRRLLDAVEARLTRPTASSLIWIVDGKSFPIGGASTDRQAGYGRAAGGKAKGYKLHAVVNRNREIKAWRLAPMNKDERVMARRLLRDADVQGYVLADAAYDDNKLHDVCRTRGQLQLLTPRRYRKSKGVGHQRHSPSRLRCLEMMNGPSSFARQLLEQRDEIERYFGQIVNFGGGLAGLPPWVRSYRRVRRWVQAKLAIHALRRKLKTTYAA